jgi:quercetin dioxygenase-like cupin family protein
MRATLAAVAALGLVIPLRTRAADDLDAPRADAAHHKVEFENEYVRVVRWSLAPHEKTALHDHPNLVSVFLTDMNLVLTGKDGKAQEVHAKKGVAAWRGPVVHVAENIGDERVEGVLVEPKGQPKAGWTPPPRDASKTTTTDRVAFENDWVRIVRFEIEKGEKNSMHDHPSGVQILLTAAHLRQTTPDGKASEVSAKAGAARYRPAFTHAVENTGGRVEGIVVDLKNAPATASR